MNKDTGVNDIPEKLTLGVTPYLETYILQNDQLLIHFIPERLKEMDFEKFLLVNNLELIKADKKDSMSRYSKDPTLPAWVRRKDSHPFQVFLDSFLTNNSQLIGLVTPVYFLEGQDEHTASSPINFLVIKFKKLHEEKIKEITENLEQLYKLEYNEQVSESIKPLHYFKVIDPIDFEKRDLTYFGIKKKISKMPEIASVEFEWIAIGGYLLPLADDPYLPSQWNLRQIQAPIQSAGVFRTVAPPSGTYLAIIDSGFEYDFVKDRSHEDLQFSPNRNRVFTHFNAEEFQLGLSPPYNAGPSIFPHGTVVAGAGGAIMNNNKGIGSVPGACEIMPIRIGVIITDVRIALGLNWASNHDAKVANLSLRCTSTEVVLNSIQNAWSSGMIICAATGNNADHTSSPPICFPARHENVIAVGASDHEDQRKRSRVSAQERECWASHYGQELDVIAPGVQIWTTDERGVNGWNLNNGGPYEDRPWCINYTSCGDLAGNYFSVFSGTSASSPQVAGLAMLLFTRDGSLTNRQVRDIIEQTCDKVNPGIYTYRTDANHPNGLWNEEVGYGRINCSAALSRVTSPPSSSTQPTTTPTPRSTLSTSPQIPLPLSQNQITDLASIGETTSRIVLVFAKNAPIDPNTSQPAPDGTEGIYKLDLDKNNPIPDIERFPLLDNASRVIPSSFYSNQNITFLAITTDKITEQVGVSYVTPDPNNSTTVDIFFSGKIIGDIYHHCPLTPKPIAGKITNIAGKFYSDGDHFVTFYNFSANGVDNLGWLGRH